MGDADTLWAVDHVTASCFWNEKKKVSITNIL